MNLSGKSLTVVKNFFKIELEELIVIHDDIDLPFGAVRFKKGGGHGGHNGLKSLDSMIGKEYIRVRIGVGKPEHKSQVADYVLHDFSQEEQEVLDKLISHVAEACEALRSEELNEVKSKFSLKSIDILEG
jgi:PTH1 family peptidyl-tRNA hydrolase